MTARDSSARWASRPPIALGDTREHVRRSLGTPAVIERLNSLGVEVWTYGGASVSFEATSGRLIEWNDPKRQLPIAFPRAALAKQGDSSRVTSSDERDVARGPASKRRADPRPRAGDRTGLIRLGDSREVVVAKLGSPWAYQRTPDRAHHILAYGRSVVRVDSASLRVDGWIARDSLFPVSRDDNDAAQRAMSVIAARNAIPGSVPDAAAHTAAHTAPNAAPNAAPGPGNSRAGSSARADNREPRAPLLAPPVLRADVKWRDTDGDGVVASGEQFTISLDVRNDGTGIATGIRPTVAVESPSLGARVRADAQVADLAPGRIQHFTVALTAASALGSSEIVLVVGIVERNGFDLSPPVRIRIPARPRGAPRIVVSDVRVEDASRDGRITPREITDVFLTITNDGDAPSPALNGRLIHGHDLFLAAGAPETFSLGAIAAHGTANVSFSLYTNTRALDVAMVLELSDAKRETVIARLPVALTIQSGAATLAVDVPSVSAPGGARGESRSPDRDSRVTVPRDSGVRDGGTVGAAPRAPRRPPTIDEVERDIPRAPALRPDAIAVIIGVERYRSLPFARYASRDADLVRRYATQLLGVPDDDEHLVLRTDAEASGNELRRLFGERGWLARHVNENTELFVYFAGHGAPDASGRVPYLLPFDADGAFVSETGFALGTLYDRLARLPARSITVALDACFSGQTRDARALIPGVRPGVLSIEHPALVRRNMAVLAAARDGESAGDLPDARHGAFTWFLARALRGEGDGDGDGTVTVAELGRFVERGVARAASQLDRSQHPLTIARDSMRVVVGRERR